MQEEELTMSFLGGWQENEITHLDRREIQAPIAECLIHEFAAVMGMQVAIKIATSAIQKDARVAGMEAARTAGGNDMKKLSRFILKYWAQSEAMTLSVEEDTDSVFSFNVTRCRYVEMYERLGMKDLGYCLSCSRDESFVRGFNPDIKLIRTKTIMEGSDHCDFRFEMEKKPQG